MEKFEAEPLVRIYVCGITPYATTHLGHARTYLTFDVLIREIEHRGHTVRYTQNVTDVDDPLFDRAQQLGVSTADLARECTRLFQDDMAGLGIRPPDFYPRASEEIPEIQKLIGSLVSTGHAYSSGDRVYFRVSRSANYGCFSRLTREEMLVSADEHGEDTHDIHKEDPLDFVLWKPSRDGEPWWSSPWGPGRPGWHIECSAMASHYLGPRLDIHGGGSDLIYPHHENEIAQSEAATGQSPFARYWIHPAMVRLDGIKMSKSLGNLVFARDLLSRYSAVGIRHYLLSTHYRAELDYSEDGLIESERRVSLLARAINEPRIWVDDDVLGACENRFDLAMRDDLNTPVALGVLDRVAQDVLTARQSSRSGKAVDVLRRMAARLGLTRLSA